MNFLNTKKLNVWVLESTIQKPRVAVFSQNISFVSSRFGGSCKDFCQPCNMLRQYLSHFRNGDELNISCMYTWIDHTIGYRLRRYGILGIIVCSIAWSLVKNVVSLF
jgi:regulator of sirC expression with transglutaminase-like and TPR domain